MEVGKQYMRDAEMLLANDTGVNFVTKQAVLAGGHTFALETHVPASGT